MWPWGHLAVGYLAYSAVSRFTAHRRPGALATVAVAIGTQFPDLVDKPLAYWWAILPEGRSLGHSLVFLIPVCLLVIALATRIGHRRAGLAFVIGYATHPFADGYGAILAGNWQALTYLVYPILPSPDYHAQSFAHHGDILARALQRIDLPSLIAGWQDGFILQIWITALVALLWILDGMPPFGRKLRDRSRTPDPKE